MSIVSHQIRSFIAHTLNNNPRTREQLEAEVGQVWDTDQLTQDFAVFTFLAPYVYVQRRADKKIGTLAFQHHPRFYFSFVEEG